MSIVAPPLLFCIDNYNNTKKDQRKKERKIIVTSSIHSCNNTRKDQRKKESKRIVLSLMTLVVIIDSQMFWRYVSYFHFILHQSYLLHGHVIVTDLLFCKHIIFYRLWHLLTWFFLHSLGIFIYSLPSLICVTGPEE